MKSEYGTEDFPLQLDDNLPSPAVDVGGGIQKKRLRLWLLDKLDTNDCPGCTWLDKEHRVFKLTWKHYGRPGFDEERDAKIFRDWAIHTRRYNLGDPTDVSTWKTRFRNALHKMPDIEELSSCHQLDGNDPYRVYRFRTPGEMEEIRNMQKIDPPQYPPRYSGISLTTPGYAPKVKTESEEIDEIKNKLLQETKTCENGNTPMSHQHHQQQQQTQRLQHQQQLQQHIQQQQQQQQQIQQQQQQQQQHLQHQQQFNNNGDYPISFDDDALEDIEKILMKEMNGGLNGDPPLQMPLQQLTTSFFPNITPFNFNNIPVSAIGAKIYFSDKEVGCNIINNLNLKGVRISYKPPPPVHPGMISDVELEEIYGPLEAEQIYYPHSEDRNTQKVLNVMQRGVVIEVNQHGDIIATRKSQARIFYSDSVTTPPKALERGVPTLVFSFQNEFLPMLECYQRGMAFSPSCERYFSFGQSWSEHEPLKEMLIHFSITHFLSKKIFKEVKAQKPDSFIQKSDADPVDMIKERLDKMYMGNLPS